MARPTSLIAAFAAYDAAPAQVGKVGAHFLRIAPAEASKGLRANVR